MKTKDKIKILKICAIVVWAFMLIFPSLFKNMQKIEYVDITFNEELSEGDYFYFNVEFSDFVSNGDVTIEFYDEDKNSVYLVTLPFESKMSKTAVVSIDKASVPETAVEYDFIEANVQTPMAKTVNNIMYPLSIAMIVVIVFIMRLNYREEMFDDDVVEIYSGVYNHTVKVNGSVVFRDKYLITVKMTTLTVDVNEYVSMSVTFRANNRIETFVINKAQTENSLSNDEQVIDSKEQVETEVLESSQTEIISTERNDDTEKLQAEIEVSETQNEETKQD